MRKRHEENKVFYDKTKKFKKLKRVSEPITCSAPIDEENEIELLLEDNPKKVEIQEEYLDTFASFQNRKMVTD